MTGLFRMRILSAGAWIHTVSSAAPARRRTAFHSGAKDGAANGESALKINREPPRRRSAATANKGFVGHAKHLNGELLRRGVFGAEAKLQIGGPPQRKTVKTMKSNAPWSVKGIERDARETAKEAARREGMTVGEWLNQIIYNAGDGAPTDGEIEGLKLRDVVTAIEHLQKRIAESHAENADTLKDVTRKVGDVVERVQRLERSKPASGGATGGNEDLALRIEKLEGKGDDRERIDALKALEKAVAQVAVQFNTAQKTSIQRLDATEQQLQQFAERLDHIGPAAENGEIADAGPLKKAIDSLSERLARTEKIASEATSLTDDADGSADPGFVESTSNRLRVLGDEIKRGGDQIRTLESTIAKLSTQIDAAERRSAEGVQKVAETLAELRESFSGDSEGPKRADIDAAVAAASRETEGRISALQASFETMIARLDALRDDESDEKAEFVAEALQAPDIGDDADEGDEVDADNAAPEADARLASDEIETDADDSTPADDEDGAPTTEAFGLVQPAGEIDEDDDDDEDPFAFADDIDAAFDDEISAEDEPKADFDFELDDETDTETPVAEAPAVFGKKAAASEIADDAEAAAPDAEGEIDQLLADIDELTGEAARPQDGAADDDTDADEEDQQTAAHEDEAETVATAEDGTKTGDGEDNAEDGAEDTDPSAPKAAEKPKKKRSLSDLTPKQKAILAARARRKRLAAAQGGAEKPVDAEKLAAAKEALKGSGEPLAAEKAETERETDEEPSRVAQMLAKVSAFRDKLPFIGKQDGDDGQEEETKAPEPARAASINRGQDGDRAAFETLKAAAMARPVTLALAVAIVLSVAVLFLMVKDFIFKAPDVRETPPAAIAASSEPATANTEAGEELEVPAPPAVEPRTLYRDAMTGLDAAETSAETAAAMARLEEAASLGHPPAQLQLGEFYKTGQGVEQDLAQARLWFRRAANGGNVLAMHRIGVMTARGDGGPATTAEAITWFELAANRGLVDSQYNLGAIYHPTSNGPATSIQDAGKAYYWYSLAAKNGDEQAAPLAASVADALSAEQKRAIDSSISEWEALPADEAANELNPQD